MAKYRSTACWLLLTVLLAVSCVVLSVGVTQARYQDRDTAVAVITPPETGVSSNCLVTKQDAPRTVLLGELDMNGSIAIPFWMLSSDADATQKLNWGVTDSDYEDYLNISVFVGYEELEAKAELELLEDVKLDLLLCIEPTKLAFEEPHDALRIPVHVTWGDEMWGTFQVILPEVPSVVDPGMMEDFWPEPETEATTESVTEPTTEPETEAATEPATEQETEVTTEPETEEATESATELVTEPGTEPGEPVAASELESQVILLSDQSAEPTTEPATEVTTEPAIEPATEPVTEAVTEPETKPTVSIVDMTGKESLIQLKSLHAFHPSQLLPVRIELPEEITTIRLGVQTVYGEHTYFESFPDYTMFSLDGGSSYYMLYGDYVPEFYLENVTQIPLLLDFSYAEIDCSYRDENEVEKMNLAMEVYVGDELFKTSASAITLSEEPSGMPILRPRVQQTEAATDAETVTIVNDTEEQLLGPILTFDNRLEFAFPVEWEEATLKYSVELLTMTEEQKLEYVPVALTKDGLNAIYIADGQMHKLVFRLGDRFITPGTYRLNMTWTYEDECFSDTQITFFIQYAPRIDTALSSQEVPNDN